MEKRVRRHKTEVVLLRFVIATGAILIPPEIGVYFNASKLAMTQGQELQTYQN